MRILFVRQVFTSAVLLANGSKVNETVVSQRYPDGTTVILSVAGERLNWDTNLKVMKIMAESAVVKARVSEKPAKVQDVRVSIFKAPRKKDGVTHRVHHLTVADAMPDVEVGARPAPSGTPKFRTSKYDYWLKEEKQLPPPSIRLETKSKKEYKPFLVAGEDALPTAIAYRDTAVQLNMRHLSQVNGEWVDTEKVMRDFEETKIRMIYAMMNAMSAKLMAIVEARYGTV